ncbi:MAG: discoidin domain-containing protein [Sedimentisphaerales bacterium]|nr:discoidin domain-containing protein [Sedimentisphaerales bacterium]
MWKRLRYPVLCVMALVLFQSSPTVLLGVFPGLATASGAEPIVYYPFDKLEDIVVDASGSGNDGMLNGGVQFVEAGYTKGCFAFNGSDSYVSLDRPIQNDFTIMAWIQTSTNGAAGTQAYQGTGLFWSDVSGVANDFVIAVLGSRFSFFVGNPDTSVNSNGTIVTGDWVHVAAVRDTASGTNSICINGVLDNSVSHSNVNALTAQQLLVIGANTLDGRFYNGLIDEVKVYDVALTEGEIETAMRAGLGKELASEPNPASEKVDVPRDVVLAWAPGQFAASHDVYFGTSFDDVNTATRANPMGVLASQGQAEASYDPEGLLAFGQTYYWRIDEVNAPPDNTIYTGEVWSFTAEPLTYTIENVVVTASTTSSPNEGPERVIDGSGLSPNGQHSNNQNHMWLGNPVGSEPVWIQFDFDKTYKVVEMHLWNYNMAFEAWLGLSAKDVTIEYTSDGTDWTTLGDFVLPQGPAVATYEGIVLDVGGIAAQALRINIHSNYGTQKSYGLSEVRFAYKPVQAREPEPADGATGLEPEVTLSWRAGREAASHQVYLSTDPNAVADGTALIDTVTTRSYDLGTLDLGMTYYWKINEVNEAETPSVWAGDVWTLTVEDYVSVEGFETYNDEDNQIFNVWSDGYENNANGSLIGHADPPFAEQVIVHSGEQSAPLYYDNTGTATISEATLTFGGPQDWTVGGAQTLVLYFRGALENTGGQLYLKVNGTRVDHGDTAALTAPLWQPWGIDLASLGNAARSVTSLTVGVSGTGAGLVYLDDIRLYRVAPPVPEEPVDPGTANLVAYYAMENNLTDGSGNGYNGTPVMSPGYGPGPTGYGTALVLDGVSSYVELPVGALIGSLTDSTFAMWVNYSGQGNPWQRLFDFGSGTSRYFFICPARGSDGTLLFEMNGPGAGTNLVPAPFALPAGWHHVAGVVDSATMEMRLYFDGALVGQGPTDTLPSDIGETTQNWLGRSQYSADPYFDGSLDDFRIYNRALSAGELRYLVGAR